jgi:putative acetyltransferase
LITIRDESPADAAAVRAVNLAAFPGPFEANLVDHLRVDGEVVVSLVAEKAGQVLGHILFCRVHIAGERAVSLSPMAVLPDWQRKGIGSLLVRQGLALCRERGERIAVVLGHPKYYPRFGFSSDAARRLEGWAAGAAWMALELEPGSLTELSGKVLYPKAFHPTEC